MIQTRFGDRFDEQQRANEEQRAAIAPYLGRVWGDENELARSFLVIASRHERDSEMRDGCKQMAEWSQALVDELEPFVERYGKKRSMDSEHVRSALFHGPRFGGMGLLRDAQDLALLAEDVKLGWTALEEAAPELRDPELEQIAKAARRKTERQIAWLETRIKTTAPNALTIKPEPLAVRIESLPKTWMPAAVPLGLWAPVACFVLAVVVGIAGAAAGMPFLVASLGPTIYLQATTPAHPATHPWNVVVGHAIGWIAGALCAVLFGVWSATPVLAGGTLTSAHAFAAALALALTAIGALLARASHPPAAATALLVALGALHGRNEAIAFAIGVAIVTLFGEGLRRARTRTTAPRSG